MVTIGFHASHEQLAPSEALELVERAEQAGFNGVLSSDHFHPWNRKQGQSGLAMAWMGAALARTSKVTMGMVNAPGQRYHPAIVAQGLGTLAEMFPDRVWAALGSGQAMNEAITGQGWPAKDERNARLEEAVSVIRRLLAGETVTHRGRVVVEEATLFTRPKTPPLLVGAAITPETAEWVGRWADGMITVSKPPAELKKMVEAFHRGGGKNKPMFLKVQLSYARTDEEARKGAHEQWATNVVGSSVLSDLRRPEQFEELAKFVKPEELDAHVRISSDLDQQLEWLRADLQLGFTRLYLHNVNLEQRGFIEAFGKSVVPRLLRSS